MKITHFKSQAEFRCWLEDNHQQVIELWVGFYKKDSGRGGITYAEALDEALCFGWIDGIRKSVDAVSYTNRFTPRKAKSNWSAINLKHMDRLIKARRVHPHGLKVYEQRDPRKAKYSIENTSREFDATSLKQFKANKTAWAFFQEQPPGYRKIITGWVAIAKRDETRTKRLRTLIDASARGCRVNLMTGKVEKL